MNERTHELIVCIINSGFSETVMDAAREAGATGGTILRGRGTANQEAEAFFQITIQPEKELVLILVRTESRDAILRAIYHAAGLGTAGQGIAFSLPMDSTAGLPGSPSAPGR